MNYKNNILLGNIKMAFKIKKWIYKHFKWWLYKVIWIWVHTEDEQEMVIYQSLDRNNKANQSKIWIRPKSMFMDIIKQDWKTFPRFEYVWE